MKAGIVESKKYVSASVQPNTFIGGVAITVPNKASLASKLNILESDITFFEIVGNDIEAFINVNYVIPGMAFQNNQNITYYREKNEGRCTAVNISAFSGTSNLLEVEFLGDTFIDQGAFGSSGLKRGIFHNTTQMYFYAPFRFASPLFLYFPKLRAPSTATELEAFGYAGAVYMPEIEQIGSTYQNNGHFHSIKIGGKIWANPLMQTINNGAEEGDIAFARTSRSAIITYGTSSTLFTSPSTISDLSFSTIYATAVKVDFTPPTSPNAVSYYEVFVNGAKHSEIQSGDRFIKNLTPDTLYVIELIAVDELYNKGEKSNPIEVTTAATATVPTRGLTWFYEHNELSGTVVNDSFGSNHGTINSVTLGAAGKLGTAYKFVKANQNYLTLPESFTKFTDAAGDLPFSISLWLMPVNVSGVKAIFGRTAFGTPWQAYMENAMINFRVTGGATVFVKEGSLKANEWNHVVLTYNGNKSAAKVCVYINNKKYTGTGAHSGMSKTPGNLFVGRNWDGNYYMDGSIDLMAGYTVELDEGEVSDLFNNYNGISLNTAA